MSKTRVDTGTIDFRADIVDSERGVGHLPRASTQLGASA